MKSTEIPVPAHITSFSGGIIQISCFMFSSCGQRWAATSWGTWHKGERDVLHKGRTVWTNSSEQPSRMSTSSRKGGKITAKAAEAITPISLTAPQGLQADLASKSATAVLWFTSFIWQYSVGAGGNTFWNQDPWLEITYRALELRVHNCGYLHCHIVRDPSWGYSCRHSQPWRCRNDPTPKSPWFENLRCSADGEKKGNENISSGCCISSRNSHHTLVELCVTSKDPPIFL